MSLWVLRSTLHLTKGEECTVSHWYTQFFAGWSMKSLMVVFLPPRYWGCLGLFLYFFLTLGLDAFSAYVLFLFTGSQLPNYFVLLSVKLVLPDLLGCTPVVTSNWALWFVFTIWGFCYLLCVCVLPYHILFQSHRSSAHTEQLLVVTISKTKQI